MNDRVKRLRQLSYDAKPTISAERAELITDFYVENNGKYPVPIMRAKAFYHLCQHKAIYIGADELIVGERGPYPKAVSTYPELTCHTIEDLNILNSRDKTPYIVNEDTKDIYCEKIIPYWQGRSMRDRIFVDLPQEWQDCYQAGMFTEFMEQRAPGHTAMDGKIYNKGLLQFKQEIEEAIASLDYHNDPEATNKLHQLQAMSISCDAAILFAKRHADLAEQMAAKESCEQRQNELLRIAKVCNHVPAYAPRDLWEALQMYWFIHLGCITELNGWDAFSPGHLDQHLNPFYQKGLADNSLTKDRAKELIACFWIKFNNHPAPPKVGVTAQESGTYNDFTNINIGGLDYQGRDGVNDVSYLLLEVVEDIHLLQPGCNIQLSRLNNDHFLKTACRVIRKGYGYPSVFNADAVVAEMVRMGKSIEDARTGGVSGCVETGCFGKEAYVLTGYLNIPKILELTLHNGIDSKSGKRIGLATGEVGLLQTYSQLFTAFKQQLHHIVNIKVRGNQYIERMFARLYPATFMSVIMDDCIKKGKDYNDGGPRYNTTFIQGVGIGSITDSLSAIKTHVYEKKTLDLAKLVSIIDSNFVGNEAVRQMLSNKTPRYGNDNDQADTIMREVFEAFYTEVEGRPNTKGGKYHIDMLPTTCHIYFGSVMGAMPDGRLAGEPLSEGISPVQGADRSGPTAVIKSAGKMDHVRTGGTLLNMSIMPAVVKDDQGITKLAQLIRSYFRMGAHHVQFNVVDKEVLRAAQQSPDQYRDLLVRVAGYSDYFIDLGTDLQNEIISRTSIERM